MYHKIISFQMLVYFLSLSACIPLVGNIQVGVETPIVIEESATATFPVSTNTPFPTETIAPTATEMIQTPEVDGGITEPINFDVIQIIEPGAGSRVIAPVHIEGMANPTFEQTIVVRIVLDDGTEFNRATTNILADVGQRGQFSIDMDFAVSGERQAIIQVFAVSPRDGGITHLASSFVTLADSGSVDIRPALFQDERIVIANPEPGGVVSGGIAHIEGFAAPSFENHLFIELIDSYGNVLGSASVIVDAPQPGIPGPFSVGIPYSISEAQAGRIVIHDPSAVIEGDVHLASTEINLQP